MVNSHHTQLPPHEVPSTLPWFKNHILRMLERMPGIFTMKDWNQEYLLVTSGGISVYPHDLEEIEIRGVLVGSSKANQPIDFTLDAQAVRVQVWQWTDPARTWAGWPGTMISPGRCLKLTKEVHMSGYKLVFRHISHVPAQNPGLRN